MAPKRRVEAGFTSSSQRRRQGSQAPPNPFGIVFRYDDQQFRYKVLANRRMLNTRYMDNNTLNALGLLDDISWLCERIGWGEFIELKHNAYVKLTLEFLSSLEAAVLRGPNCEEGLISFRLFNNEHNLTLAEFNAIYSLPIGGSRRLATEFSAQCFWNSITNFSEFNAANLKATWIHNPCFRYLHRLLAHTIFGRGDSDGVVRQDELFFLWAMYTGHPVDTGSHMVRHLLKVGKADKGDIVVGGLITPLALHYGYHIEGLEQAGGSTRIDMDSCLAMKMIVKQGDRYALRIREFPNMSILLPSPRTSIQNTGNWKYSSAVEEADMHEDDIDPVDDAFLDSPDHPAPSQTDPSTHHGGSSADIDASISALHAEQQSQRRLLESMNSMMQQMYGWHVSHGHFSPPPS